MNETKLDVKATVAAVGRELRGTTRDGTAMRVIVVTRTYPTTLEDAWDALTSKERIPRWFLPITGELKVGGRFQFEGNAGGTVTTCEPPKHLAATWEMMGQVSWVDVTLASLAKDKTRLTLEHTAAVDEGLWDKFGPGAVGIGWEMGLIGLDLHCRAPAFDARAEGKAWATSENAKDIIRASSAAWCDASIAGGTDAKKARAAAESCAKAYTGEA
jgi:uncharacterized protein YndB with AHSA1/START domain